MTIDETEANFSLQRMGYVLLLLSASRPRAQHRQSRLRPQRVLSDLHHHRPVHRLGLEGLRSLLLASCLRHSFLHPRNSSADLLPPSWRGCRLSRHVPGLPRHVWLDRPGRWFRSLWVNLNERPATRAQRALAGGLQERKHGYLWRHD